MPGYDPSPAYHTSTLRVSLLHTLHYTQHGNPAGLPLLFLHGGPGGNTSASNTAFFDPRIYRVVLFDQRGAGRSTPQAELAENTTAELIEDIEKLRREVGVEKWAVVFGGSWGSTLGLLYAQAFPERVGGLILRGIFLARRSEVLWGAPTREAGAAQLFPDAAAELLAYLRGSTPAFKDEDWEATLYAQLTSADRAVRVAAARALNMWDIGRSSLLLDAAALQKVEDEAWSLHHAILEFHYLYHGAFVRDGQILEEAQMQRIRHIPCTIVQGRYDAVCPAQAAWDLHEAWPEAKFVMVPDAGHSALEPGTFAELVKACDEFGKMG